MLDSLLLTALGGVLGIARTLAATVWQGSSARDGKREQNAARTATGSQLTGLRRTRFLQAAGVARQAMGRHAGQGGGTGDLLKPAASSRPGLAT